MGRQLSIKQQGGFTLVEMLVVVGLIVIVASMLGVGLAKAVNVSIVEKDTARVKAALLSARSRAARTNSLVGLMLTTTGVMVFDIAKSDTISALTSATIKQKQIGETIPLSTSVGWLSLPAVANPDPTDPAFAKPPVYSITAGGAPVTTLGAYTYSSAEFILFYGDGTTVAKTVSDKEQLVWSSAFFVFEPNGSTTLYKFTQFDFPTSSTPLVYKTPVAIQPSAFTGQQDGQLCVSLRFKSRYTDDTEPFRSLIRVNPYSGLVDQKTKLNAKFWQ